MPPLHPEAHDAPRASFLQPEVMPCSAEAFLLQGATAEHFASAWIIDPGLSHLRGHHYSLDRVLMDALKTRAQVIEVLCRDKFLHQPGFVPCFEYSIYQVQASTPQELSEILQRHDAAFFGTLCAVVSGRVRADDLLLLPSAHFSLLPGLHRWLSSLTTADQPRNIRLHFHTLPMHDLLGQETQQLANAYFVKEAQRLHAHYSIRWSADHPKLAAMLTQLCGFEFKAIKSPQCIPQGIHKRDRHDHQIRFLFIGAPRAEKGFSHLLQALPEAIKKTHACHFRIVVPSLARPIRKALSRLPARRLSLRVQEGLPDAEYLQEIADADYVLCAYDPAPENYAFRSSGIVTEAALLGTPVVITRGMAIEDNIADPQRVRVLPDNTPQSLTALLVEIDRSQVLLTPRPLADGKLRTWLRRLWS